MKLKTLLLPLMCICMILSGCNTQQNKNGISFYYCQKNIDYDSPQGTIGSEVRKDQYDPLAYNDLLSTYLKGPKANDLSSPFPQGTSLVNFSLDQQTANVVLSDHIAELTGVDLTLACTCLSLTIKDMTGCANVQIRAQNELLENHQVITINANEIHLSDIVQ